jgi:hypothetical protein
MDEAASEIGEELAGCRRTMGVEGMRVCGMDGWWVVVVVGGATRGGQEGLAMRLWSVGWRAVDQDGL